MNLKDILKSSTDIEKSYWVFVRHNQAHKSKFVKVKCKYGPEIFGLILVQEHQETVICNNYVYVRKTDKKSSPSPGETIIGKEYTIEEYFNYSTLYNLPTPQELKEIRKYFKKNHKNHQVTVYLGKKTK